ncbi:acyltransferase family protein [Bacillus sp. REN10]|uniref:acyltransferase family protein n=1 Tax=Bacillus sp. REN10 TaxID=2782541 RepID=UPI00193C439E|nr:acyltransferase family protein [Bacillus sp. REN10]
MSKRDYYFDNAKFILIVFVVFGHFLRSYISDSPPIFALYASIYLFHMPAFVLVSGFFAKSFYKKGYVKKTAQKILLPFFTFQIIYSIFYFYLYETRSFELDLLIPHWSLWFLLSLFFWNVLLLISVKWLKLPASILLPFTFIAGVTVSCIPHHLDVLSFARTFVFFPFFLVGYYLKKEHFQFLSRKMIKIPLLLSAILIFFVAYTHSDFDFNWFFGSISYADLSVTNGEGMITRIVLYVLNFIMIAFFFAFVPKKKFFFTAWGKNTLYVYLLHGFIIKSFRDSDFQDGTESIIVLLTFSLLLTMLLSSSVVTTITQPFIEAKWTKFKELFHHQSNSKNMSEKQ